MERQSIKDLMDNYIGEYATPEQRAEAEKFVAFLESQSDLEAVLYRLRDQYRVELNMMEEQIRKKRRRVLTYFIIMLLAIIAAYLLAECKISHPANQRLPDEIDISKTFI